MEKKKQACHHAALELFYMYGPQSSKTSLEIVEKNHLYSKVVDAYSARWLAQKFWKEEWDPKYFKGSFSPYKFVAKTKQPC
jgi:hypothetical protein